MEDSPRALLLRTLQSMREAGRREIYIGPENWRFLLEILKNTPQAMSPAKHIPPSPSQQALLDDSPAAVVLPPGFRREQWEWLRSRVLNSEDFQRHLRPGKRLVFGVGNLEADILFCGEAPGADEEIQGIPFVGRAGQLLTKIILAMGLTREEVYITNIMNWRPETAAEQGNRPPTQEEMEHCLPYLRAQLAIVQPRVIVALGATAVNGLLGYDGQRRITLCRGQWYFFQNIPLMVTFHPSYLLRNQNRATKRLVWEDMLAVLRRVGRPISERQERYFL
ncbi:MAG: uracil-DNA glycosylase [Puniceicoccales bacterium]|jgi:DNA polymerase|nr:uracil-DNA glycosylase [Puniceicoccales bacterium]